MTLYPESIQGAWVATEVIDHICGLSPGSTMQGIRVRNEVSRWIGTSGKLCEGYLATERANYVLAQGRGCEVCLRAFLAQQADPESYYVGCKARP